MFADTQLGLNVLNVIYRPRQEWQLQAIHCPC